MSLTNLLITAVILAVLGYAGLLRPTGLLSRKRKDEGDPPPA